MMPKNILQKNPETFAEIVRVAREMKLPMGIRTIEALALAARIKGRVEVSEELKNVRHELSIVLAAVQHGGERACGAGPGRAFYRCYRTVQGSSITSLPRH
jgi:hypothetical protein